MNRTTLFLGLCEIDEDLILAAKEAPMKQTRTVRPMRIILIAAAVTIFLCGAASAAYYFSSLHEKARVDMGITDASKIEEYTEYSAETPDTAAPSVTLVSALCSGQELVAYVNVTPISKEQGALLQAEEGLDNFGLWEIADAAIDGGELGPCTYGAQTVSYDPETGSALVRLRITNCAALEQAEEFTASLSYFYQNGPEQVFFQEFSTIAIPITRSDSLHTALELPLDNFFLDAEGTVTELELCAGYLTLRLQIPTFETAVSQLGENAYQQIGDAVQGYWNRQLGIERDTVYTELDATHYYDSSWEYSVETSFADLTLNYHDGTSAVVSSLERPYASVWNPVDGNYETMFADGVVTYRCTLAEPLALSDLESVTICGVTYPLSAE